MDSEAKKACSTQAETNQRHLYAHCTATYTSTVACTLHQVHITVHYSQVVLPAYIIAPVKIHAELEKVLLIHVTLC